MADLEALFNEVSKLSKAEAGQLKEMLQDKMPKSEPKAAKAEEAAAEEAEG